MARTKPCASSVATLIGDVVGSRRVADRRAAHRALNRALDDVAPGAIDPPAFTVGDEFQGSYPTVGAAIDAALSLRLAVGPAIDVRFGIGWGEVTMLDASAGIQDGPGWWAAREAIEKRSSVVGANSLARLHYVPPKFPASTRGRSMSGWVELEFTVLTDGKTGDVVVTNSSPRKTFDKAAVDAVEQWRYEPVVRRGKVVEQRAAVRIRFTEE